MTDATLAAELAGRVRVAKRSVDEILPRRRARIPTLLVFKNGREIDRLVGALPRPEIARRLKQALA